MAIDIHFQNERKNVSWSIDYIPNTLDKYRKLTCIRDATNRIYDQSEDAEKAILRECIKPFDDFLEDVKKCDAIADETEFDE